MSICAELLAPAGSWESMTAAFSAGADAVYLGGSRFGARAYAQNLDTEQLLRGIDYAHILGKRLYLTVNTLVKDDEMETLYADLLPLYREGLDAVIVQDFGVFAFLRKCFPGLSLHASTQMTVTGPLGAAFLQRQGASRVVTARELSLEEIQAIYRETGMEIESFVHGALCYCYSGQCLLSSFLGGRSGNRGRCAQPCRLPWKRVDGRENRSHPASGDYLLSPKDLCTLSILPEILESGVYSLKIEGRMKKPEYTAGVTAIYRKYLDRYFARGREGYKVEPEDMRNLMDLYNRGGFTDGYYQQRNGAAMMSMQRPNHWGTPAASMAKTRQGMKWKALEPLCPGDILELRDKKGKIQEYICQKTAARGGILDLPFPAQREGTVYRTRNEALIRQLTENYVDVPQKRKIYGKFILFEGKSAILELACENNRITEVGAVGQQAQNRPLSEAEAARQIRKMGNSSFVLDHLEIQMGTNVFLPVQALKDLRRRALAQLEEQLLTPFRRNLADGIAQGIDPGRRNSRQGVGQDRFCTISACMEQSGTDPKTVLHIPAITVSVETAGQFFAALACPEVSRIYLDAGMYGKMDSFLREAPQALTACREHGKTCFLALPWIWREDHKNGFHPGTEAARLLQDFDGMLIRNLEEYEFLRRQKYPGVIWPDANLYRWNQWAKEFWRGEGLNGGTLPLELTARELSERGCAGEELIVYGAAPLMISAQCAKKNTSGCDGVPAVLELQDRKAQRFRVKTHCAFCYTVLYNGVPTDLAGDANEVRSLSVSAVRIQLTTEDSAAAQKILAHEIQAFFYKNSTTPQIAQFTRGHFRRKVE